VQIFFLGAALFSLALQRSEIFFFLLIPVCVSGFFLALLSVAQYFSPGFLFADFFSYDAVHRSIGTFGQPNSLGRFLLIPFFFGCSFFFLPKKYIPYQKYFLSSFLLLLALGIGATGSRAALLALFLGVMTLFLFHFLPFFRQKKRRFLLFLFAPLLFFLLFFSFSSERFASLETRKYLWSGTTELIIHQPFLGSGLESFTTSFPVFSPPELQNENNIVPTRAHNEILDWGVQIGVLGAIFWILFFFSLFFLGGKRAQKDPFFLGITLAILAPFLARQFEFGTTTEYILLAVCVAVLLQGGSDDKKTTTSKYLLFFLGIWSLFVLGTAGQYLRAEYALSQGNFREASATLPFSPRYGILLLDSLIQKGSFEEAKEQHDLLLPFLHTSPDFHFLSARMFWQLGDLEKALEGYQLAQQKDPQRTLFQREYERFLEVNYP